MALSAGQRHPILDGNVKRVLARHFAVAGWPGERAVEQRLWELAEACTPTRAVDIYTQAIMDLGATVCTRARPDCSSCPLAGTCLALDQGQVSRYPGTRPAKVLPVRQAIWLLREQLRGHPRPQRSQEL